MALSQLSYYSRPASGVTAVEVQSILDAARKKNLARGITGLLLFRDGFFAQVLEGSREAVSGLVLEIVADKRHHDIRILGMIDVPERRFDGWSMAYLSLTEEHVGVLVDAGVDSDLDLTTASHVGFVEAMSKLSDKFAARYAGAHSKP